MQNSVGVAIITHCSRRHLHRCLPPLKASKSNPRILVVNSSSNDGTVEEARRLGAETLVIPRASFNHGTTREQARKWLETDIVVMMTPDAYATQDDMLDRLIEPLTNDIASISYARQIPHNGAKTLESFPRFFNYPASSHTRSIEDLATWGSYTFFCSNSCAAYRNEALDSVGGFKPLLMAEDALATVELLRKGHHIAYVAEAVVQHSHTYSLWQEFCRHFDAGFARRQLSQYIDLASGDSARGREYVRQLMSYLVRSEPHLIPYAGLHVLAKWFGYTAGQFGHKIPSRLQKAFSTQDFYW